MKNHCETGEDLEKNVRGWSAWDSTEKSFKCHSMHSYIIQYCYDVTVMLRVSLVLLDHQKLMHVLKKVLRQVFNCIGWMETHVWGTGVILHPFICIWYTVIKRVRLFIRQWCPVRQLCPGYKKHCVHFFCPLFGVFS